MSGGLFMKILAVEFSSNERTVAMVEGADYKAALVRGRARENGGRNTRTLALVEEALRESGWEREEIEVIAVGLGPGSYTGIRMAIAFAQGWQLARSVRLVGISSAECIAAQVHASGYRGEASVVIDAQRNEIYLARYVIGPEGWSEKEPLRLAQPGEADNAQNTMWFGPEVRQWFASGTVLFPEAATLGKLACGRTDFVNGGELEPIYLRETSFVKAPPPRVIP
jgi:tRNA threonylcarbamoyladenosine biosynthesis protein TsaB